MMGVLHWRKIIILVDPKQISVSLVSKSAKQKEKKKGFLPAAFYATGALRSTFFIFFGPDLFGGGPANNISRGAVSAAADTADSYM